VRARSQLLLNVMGSGSAVLDAVAPVGTVGRDLVAVDSGGAAAGVVEVDADGTTGGSAEAAGDEAPAVVEIVAEIGVDGEIDVEAWPAVPITVVGAADVAAADVLLCAGDA
jgi:hypothetical protein